MRYCSLCRFLSRSIEMSHSRFVEDLLYIEGNVSYWCLFSVTWICCWMYMHWYTYQTRSFYVSLHKGFVATTEWFPLGRRILRGLCAGSRCEILCSEGREWIGWLTSRRLQGGFKRHDRSRVGHWHVCRTCKLGVASSWRSYQEPLVSSVLAPSSVNFDKFLERLW